MTGIMGAPQEPYNLQGTGYRAWQTAVGIPQNVAWLGHESAKASYSLLAPLVEIVKDVSIQTLTAIGPAGISLLWLVPEETYESMAFSTLGEFSAVDRVKGVATTKVFFMMILSSLASGSLAFATYAADILSPGLIGNNFRHSFSPSLKLYAYFLLNFLLHIPPLGLDRLTSQDTGKGLIIYSCLQAVNLAMLSSLFYQNNRKVINLLKANPQGNGFKQKLVAGLSAASVAAVNLFILQGVVNKILTIIPGIFILSQMKQPEQGILFRAETLPYLSGDKSCDLLYLSGMDPNAPEIADQTIFGGPKLFNLCNTVVKQVHSRSQFISGLKEGSKAFGKIPNVIISGHGNSEVGQKMGGFLFNPNNTPELIEELKKHLAPNASVILASCESASPSLAYYPDTYAARVAKLLKSHTIHGILGTFTAQQARLKLEEGKLIPSMTGRTIDQMDHVKQEITFHPAGTEKAISYYETV